MQQITTFSEIKLIKNSLIVLDIDDTIIKSNLKNTQWWNSTYIKYMNSPHNFDDTLIDWMKRENICGIPFIECIIDINIYNFLEKLNQLNCKLILLTARSYRVIEMTKAQLHYIKFPDVPIYCGVDKGDILFNVVNENYYDVNDIIVVDDIDENLLAIQSTLSDYNLYLYQMT